MSISPTDEQNQAIKAIVTWYGDTGGPQEFYLAGFAGVGKSTLVSIAIEEIKAKYKIKNVVIAAYTGKAASVLRRKGIEDAMTIHNAMYRVKTNKETGELTGFKISRASPAAEAHLIVLDECSMVDEKMRADLLSLGKKVLIMGDPGQLPPVKGAGAFTNREPDVFLREIHRQAADSPILELATWARNGKTLPMGYDKGGIRVLPLNMQNGDLIHAPETQVICGLNNVRWTVTKKMRDRLRFTTELPIKDERIMCCKNNHAEGIYNGMMDKLMRFKTGLKPEGAVSFDFQLDDENEVTKGMLTDPYLFRQHVTRQKADRIPWEKGNPFLNEFDFSYVVTCHKAQGSQYPHVTVIDDSESFRMEKDKWLYTALTRAESGLTILRRDK